MSNASKPHGPIAYDYFTDILCVWAWIAERRCGELEAEFGESLVMRPRYLDLFGDTESKIGIGWSQKGGYLAFAKHVQDVAARYPESHVNPRIWSEVRPSTSANAHLAIHAVEISAGRLAAIHYAKKLREAFFCDAADISRTAILEDRLGDIDVDTWRYAIQSGEALMGLLKDIKLSHQMAIQGSPSWVMNEGRQILYGNVGYRVIRANFEELIHPSIHGASWC